MNLDLLMNCEPAIEEGIRTLFTEAGIFAVTRQNAPEEFQTQRPRVEIKAHLGAATGHKYVTTPANAPQGVILNDTFFFELAIRAVTAPQNEEQSNLLNNEFVARIRGMAQTFAQSTWGPATAAFPYHLIVEPLMDRTTDRTLQSDDNDEFSILDFSGIVQIRTDAWTTT
jgi:hypothetical protein